MTVARLSRSLPIAACCIALLSLTARGGGGDGGDIDGPKGFRLVGGPIFAIGDGRSVASAGDLNGDGIDDLVIGFPRTFNPGFTSFEGDAYVVFGRAGAESFGDTVDLDALGGTDGFRLKGVSSSGYLGSSVAAAGDVNGDGIDDLIIGARDFAGRGRAYVVFGTRDGVPAEFDLENLNGENGFTVLGGFSQAFGTAVAGIGDFNADGVDDIAIGDPQIVGFAPPSGSSFGTVSVLFGRAVGGFDAEIFQDDLDGLNGIVFRNTTSAQEAGSAISSAGDFNGDGVADFVVGAPSGGLVVYEGGAAQILFGAPTGAPPPATAPLFLSMGEFGGPVIRNFDALNNGDPSTARAGVSVAGGGDINGDGFDDVIVGAPGETTGDPGFFSDIQHGAAIVFFGGPDRQMINDVNLVFAPDLLQLDGVTAMRINGEVGFDRLGHAVAIAGDVNGDGLDDLLIGALQASPDGSMAGSDGDGAVYVIFGRGSGFPGVLDLAMLTAEQGFRINGVAASASNLGIGVAGAGDVNGDGIDDLIVQANKNQDAPEQAFILFGSPALSVQDWEEVIAVPEPGAVATGLTAVVAMAALRRRRSA